VSSPIVGSGSGPILHAGFKLFVLLPLCSQSDMLHTMLTVQECLDYCAQLRLPFGVRHGAPLPPLLSSCSLFILLPMRTGL